MTDQEEKFTLEKAVKLVEILDRLLNETGWESPFLKKAEQRILELRKEAQQLVAEIQGASPEKNQLQRTTDRLGEGYVKVYIFLYQVQSNNLQIWLKTLKSLVQYGVSRPIYANEDHIRELVRSKQDMVKYGYATVMVKKDDIIQTATPFKDGLGHETITVKENAILPENILGFVHANAKQYKLVNGELIPVPVQEVSS